MNRKSLKGTDYIIAAALLAGYFAVLLATTGNVGFVRDEGYYFKAAQDYNGWFVSLWDNTIHGHPLETFKRENIDRYFSYNHEHPALMKELFGFTWQIFHNGLNIVSNSTAMRLPGMFFGGLAIALVYLFTAQIRNRRSALFAAFAMASVPRFFFHSHLSCFDVPITAMVLFTVYAYWLSENSTKWGWLTGVVFGFALATKHNAWFIPFALVLCWAWNKRREFSTNNSGGGASFSIPPVPLAFVTMLFIGPIIFLAHWPWLWPAIGERLGGYFNFHLQHEHYPVSYLNEVYDRPPFPKMFVFVMTAVTVPLSTLLVSVSGLVRNAASLVMEWFGTGTSTATGGGSTAAEQHFPDSDTKFLLLVNAIYPFMIFLLPGTPIFGGVKHWFPAMPFLCILAGLEFDRLLDAVAATGKPILKSRLLPAAAGFLLILPAVLGNLYVHPYGTGFYNELDRGTRGAADQEMQRKFWGYASRGVLDWLNKNAEPYSRVAFHRTNWDSYNMYIKDGLLRPDIRYANDPEDADYLVFHYQKAFLETEYKAWYHFGNEKAMTGVYIDEAPFVQVYKRNRR
jgi:4-amino-4-deoxy-L-arabinose transferase-like glycosyltransferase